MNLIQACVTDDTCTSNYSALLHFGTNFAILLLIISAKLMNN